MNIRLYPKQIMILGLAMILAIASYWIPTPQQSTPLRSAPEPSDPVGNSGSTESIAFAREPATTWRFPVAEQIPQTMPVRSDSAVRVENAPLEQPLSGKQFLDPQELANGDATRLDNALILPVKNPDQLQKR